MPRPSNWPRELPYIDDGNVTWDGVSDMRHYTSRELKELQGAVVFHLNGEPLVVMVSYATYISMQEKLEEKGA